MSNGPWEDYTPQQESGPWSDYQSDAAPIAKPVGAKIKGDLPLEQRMDQARKLLSTKPAFQGSEQPNVARERVGIGSELVGGIKDVGSSLMEMLTNPASLLPGSARGDVGSPDAKDKLMLGLLRTAGAPFAPLTNVASAGGEVVSDALQSMGLSTAADVAGAGTQIATDFLLPSGIAKAAGKIAPLAKTKFASGRSKYAAAEKEAVQKVESLASGEEAAKDSVLSWSDAAKQQAPTGNVVRERLAKNAPLGEDVGAGFKDTYQKRLTSTKEQFSKRYDDLLAGAEDVPAEAAGYKAAFEKTLGEKGISRPLPTRAEKTAQGAKSALELDEEAAQQVDALKTQIGGSRDPAAKRMAQDALDEYMAQSKISDSPTLSELVLERQRLKAGERVAFQAKDDNLLRQFRELRTGLDNDIRAVSPDTLSGLEQIGADYIKDFVPYFSKKATTRAIAEGSPERVVDDIIRPATDKKALEKVTRSFELIEDPAQQEAVRKAFLNKGIEGAFDGTTFKPETFTKWWDKYTNPAGNDNRVLRTALGDKYKDAEEIVNTLRTVKPKEIDSFAQETVKNMSKWTTVKEKEVIANLKKAELEFLGAKPGEGAGRYIGQMAAFQGAGSLAMGNPGGAAVKLLAGGALMMARPVMQRFMEFKRGRSLLKAAFRTAPGTTKAAAQARMIKSFADQIREKD